MGSSTTDMVSCFDQNDLEKYVKLSKMALNLAGLEDKEIFEKICESFTEKSKQKLKELGLVEGEYTLWDLEASLDSFTDLSLTLEEELKIPQKSEETAQFYLKRLKSLLPQFGEDAPSVEEFLKIYGEGLHPNLRESSRTVILEQMKRLSRVNLKSTIEQLDSALKVISDSSKERILKPRNTCYFCNTRQSNAFDLDTIDDTLDSTD